MSILLVELVPQGIIIGADRNISSEQKEIKHEDRAEDGLYIEQHHVHFYHSPRPKVLRWPQRKAIIGYAGEAYINGMPTDEWLYFVSSRGMSAKTLESMSRAAFAGRLEP
jgi:hypothetical protein